jgi:L-fucose mutarotase
VLKNIDAMLAPELLTALAEMGHGDVLAIVDRNYPAHSSGHRVVDLPGADATRALGAVLTLLPVDSFQDPSAWHMLQDDGRAGPAMEEIQRVLDAAEGRSVRFAGISRTDFYARARGAYCIVSTSDARPFACFLIAKGIVR